MNDIKGLHSKVSDFIVPAAVVGISVIVAVLVVIPQARSYMDDRPVIEEIEVKASKVETKVKDLSLVDEDQVDRKLKVIFSVLPEQPRVPEAVFAISDTATESGVILEDISFASAVKGSSNNFILRGNVIGPVKGIQTFLTGLHNSPRVLSIESVEASISDGDTASTDIPVMLYYKPGNNKPLNSDQPLPKLSADEEKMLADITLIVERFNDKLESFNQAPSVQLGKTNPFQN